METENLHLFTEVMHHRSFSVVAKAHGVAPSSISRSISSLESEIGIRLFQRTTRQIVPTEAGLLYFERITVLLEDLETACQLASEVNSQPRGVLKISVSKVFGELHLAPVLAEFARKYPEISLELILDDRYCDLLEERVDIAIRVGTLGDSTYISRLLMPMSFFICASPQYLQQHGIPRQPEEVIEHNCLLFPRSGYNFNWFFRQKKNTQEVMVKGKYTITQSSAIRQCTLDGMGISLLPDWLISKEIEAGKLVRLFSDYEVTATDYKGAVWMLYPSREYLPIKVRLFSEYLLECFSK